MGSCALNVPRFLYARGYDGLFAAGLAVLLLLCAAAVASDLPTTNTSTLRMQPLTVDGRTAGVQDDGQALRVGSRPGQVVAARLHIALPDPLPEGARWVIRVARAPVDSIQLRGNGWRSATRGFFMPADDEGPLPSGFNFVLPEAWQGGAVDLDLHASADIRTLLRPQLMPMEQASRLERSGVAIAAMIYASLFTLALLALALFSAARDRLFLVFFGCATLTLLMLAAENGHLYQAGGLRWLAGWGAQGVLALGFLSAASILQLVLQYAGTRAVRADVGRVIDVVCLSFVGLAALCLLDLPVLLPWLQPAAMLGWASCGAIGLLLVADAGRRSVPMAWPLLMLAVLTVACSLLVEAIPLGERFDPTWLRHGYQIGLVACLCVLAVGLISRIGEYRNQRDRDRLARVDSERRMHREAARSDLGAALQVKLRSCIEDDIQWTSFRLLLDHLMPLVRVAHASVFAQGYRGQDVRVILPGSRKAEVEVAFGVRRLALKRHAANGIPLQQPVTVTSVPGDVAMEALVPLQIRAPGWGVLLLERAGGDGFTTEELALAGELARLTMSHADQALATIALRRSAELDALTGTFNRRTIDQWLVRGFGDAIRDGQPISVLFVDMDHFKAINDKHGHACGDHCLRLVAATLRAALGEGDLLGRYGGEEFIAVLPGRGAAAARALGEQLRAAVEGLLIEWEGQVLRLTVSVGVATRLDSEVDPTDSIQRADKALYAAKREGRNRVLVAPAIFS